MISILPINYHASTNLLTFDFFYLIPSELFASFNRRSVTYWDVAIVYFKILFANLIGFVHFHSFCISLAYNA